MQFLIALEWLHMIMENYGIIHKELPGKIWIFDVPYLCQTSEIPNVCVGVCQDLRPRPLQMNPAKNSKVNESNYPKTSQ